MLVPPPPNPPLCYCSKIWEGVAPKGVSLGASRSYTFLNQLFELHLSMWPSHLRRSLCIQFSISNLARNWMFMRLDFEGAPSIHLIMDISFQWRWCVTSAFAAHILLQHSVTLYSVCMLCTAHPSTSLLLRLMSAAAGVVQFLPSTLGSGNSAGLWPTTSVEHVTYIIKLLGDL